MMRSGNPALRTDAFQMPPAIGIASSHDVATIEGTINKCFILFALTLATAFWSWGQALAGSSALGLMTIGSAIVGFILVLVLSFKPALAPFLAPAYALVEGVFLGAVSALIAGSQGTIVMQAVALTMGVFFAMLIAYRSGTLRATPKMAKIVFTGLISLLLVRLGGWIASLFGVNVAFLYDSSPLSIGISLIAVGLAAFMLILDFDFIEQNARGNAPKHMEWYGAFALLVTLIWLYIEMLRLVAKLQNRD